MSSWSNKKDKQLYSSSKNSCFIPSKGKAPDKVIQYQPFPNLIFLVCFFRCHELSCPFRPCHSHLPCSKPCLPSNLSTDPIRLFDLSQWSSHFLCLPVLTLFNTQDSRIQGFYCHVCIATVLCQCKS